MVVVFGIVRRFGGERVPTLDIGGKEAGSYDRLECMRLPARHQAVCCRDVVG